MQHPDKTQHRFNATSIKRNRRTLYTLCAALLFAAAFQLLLPVIRRTFPNTQNRTNISSPLAEILYEGDAKELYELIISQRWGESYTLRSQDGGLYLLQNNVLEPLDKLLTQRILHVTVVLAVEDTISDDGEEISGHLRDMGLDPPEITVHIRYLDGREDMISMGYIVPGTACYYYQWSGSDKIYMCDPGTFDAFSYPAGLLLPLRQPDLRKGLIDHITIRLQGQEKIEMAFSTDIAGLTGGTLLAPFAYPMDIISAENLINTAADFRLGSFVGPLTLETKPKYGFDNPLAIIDIHQASGVYGGIDEMGVFASFWADEESLRLTIGRKEGEFFYTCEYGGECYLVSKLLVAGFLSATMDTLMTWNPADMGEDIIAEIRIQWNGRLLDFRQNLVEHALPDHPIDADEMHDSLNNATYTQNGEPMSGDAFEALVNRLKDMRSSGHIGESFVVGNATPRWQMSITTFGGEVRTITAYPLNVFFDAIAVNGTVRHELRVESLETVLGELWQQP